MHRFISRSPIYDTMNIHPIAGGKVKYADFSYLFHNTSMGIHRIANRGTGGGSPHNFPFFPYISVLGVTDIQRLDCAESAVTAHCTFEQCMLHPPGTIGKY